MSSDTKKAGNGSGAGSGGFRAKLDHYLYSGEKKHVAAGIVIIGALFGVPWYLMNREMPFGFFQKRNHGKVRRLNVVSFLILSLNFSEELMFIKVGAFGVMRV
ncbi:UNVERIFIED_CONTAM: hypothetical protein Sindi_1187800 [Sesamum indicum]